MQKRNIILIVMLSIMLITIIGAASYAYLRTTSAQGNNNTVSTITCLELSYLENSGDRIILNEAYPVSDNVGLYQMDNTYSFGLRNNCTVPILAEVNLESLNIENKLDPNYIKVAIITRRTTTPSGSILGTRTAKDATIEGATSNLLLYELLAPGEEFNYSIKLWIDSATTVEQGLNKHYEGKVVAIAKPIVPVKKNEVLTNAQSGTLLANIRDGNSIFSKPITSPGRAVSSYYERIISSTPDDYGTSYYYRGAVENNYVSFANMCWRIVRITGNGAIKLALANYASADCTTTSTNSAIARDEGSTAAKSVKFNEASGGTGSVGYMYGSLGSSSYAEEQSNDNPSTILTFLSGWYQRVFSTTQKNLIADVIWCNDKSTSSTGYGTGGNYGAYTRLNNSSSANPSLVCPQDKLGGKLSKFTAAENTIGNATLHNEDGTELYKIGLLTADEFAFAGTMVYTNSTSYYLARNANVHQLTLSPADKINILYIKSGTSINRYSSNSPEYVRPSIALIPNIRVTLEGTGDPGTATNPYVVNESYNYNS